MPAYYGCMYLRSIAFGCDIGSSGPRFWKHMFWFWKSISIHRNHWNWMKINENHGNPYNNGQVFCWNQKEDTFQIRLSNTYLHNADCLHKANILCMFLFDFGWLPNPALAPAGYIHVALNTATHQSLDILRKRKLYALWLMVDTR